MIHITGRQSDPTFEVEGKQKQVFGRWYTASNGLMMPSSTTVINPVSGYHPKSDENFASVSEKLAKRKAETGSGKTLSEYRDAAAERGTQMHSICEAVDKGEAVGEVGAEFQKDVAAYQEWVKKNPQRTVKQNELFVFSMKYGFAGQLDCLSYDEELKKYKIEDKKTGRKVKVYAGWQLMSYAIAAEEMGLIDSADNCLLEVQHIRDGKVSVFKYQHTDWLRACFESCLQCWKALNFNFGLMDLHKAGKYPWLFAAVNRDTSAKAA